MKKLRMTRLAALPIALWLAVAAAQGAFARADAYYTVLCDDGNAYESVDGHAVEQGHNDDAVVNFSENTPFGLTCWLEGPFNR
jgi:hypothetical protein